MAEEILGQAIKGRRDQVIISTKGTFRFGAGPNDVGSSRYHLIRAVEASLRRLGTDYIDLYQLHGFDAMTPVEEVLGTLDDLVRAGKIRYVGCSNFSGWHLMKSLAVSEHYGLARYVAHQAYYSLIGRDYEWELMPLALDQKVGAVVWSPLGWGRLTGKIRRGQPLPETSRLQSKLVTDIGPPVADEYLYRVVDALDEVAKETGKTVPQIALNWLLQRPSVANVIIGARNEEQLRQNLGAVGWNLTRDRSPGSTPPAPPRCLSLLAPARLLGTKSFARMTCVERLLPTLALMRCSWTVQILFSSRPNSQRRSRKNLTFWPGYADYYTKNQSCKSIARYPMVAAERNYWTDAKCAKAFWGQHELPPYRQLLEDTITWAEPAEGEHWLDLGCGGGAISKAIWEKTQGKVGSVLGVDCGEANDLKYQQLQESLLPRTGNRVRFQCHNFSAGLHPFSDRSFDHAISGLSISYAESYDETTKTWNTLAYERLLREVFRILKPNGKFVFSVNVPEPSWLKVGLSSLGAVFSTGRPLRFLKNSWRMMRTENG